MGIDSIVTNIQKFSGSAKDLQQLVLYLNKEQASISKTKGLSEPISVLDPAQHTVGLAFFWEAKLKQEKNDPAQNFGPIKNFLLKATNFQARMVASRFSFVAHVFANFAITLGKPMAALKTLKVALEKCRQSSEALTSIHADYLHCCLLSKNYPKGKELLSQEIFECNPEHLVNPRDFMLYFYYGGLINIGLKDFPQAFLCFKNVITTPAAGLYSVMIEGYKKYVLTSLMVFGRVESIPRYAPSIIQKHHKTSFPAYTEFATAYSTHSTDDLHKIAETHLEVFKKDKNFGLVKQVIQRLYRENIQRLTQTFITTSIKDITERVKLSQPEVEKAILTMVEKQEVFAFISQEAGMVAFVEDPEAYDSREILNKLDKDVQNVISLGQKVRAVDREIALSTTYISRTAFTKGYDDEEGSGGGMGGGLGLLMGMGMGGFRMF